MTHGLRDDPSVIPDSPMVGLGLRFPHLAALLERPEQGLLLEIHSENLFCLPEVVYERLEKLRVRHSFSLHGVGLSLGSFDALDPVHLGKLAQQVRRYEPVLVSDHLAWNRACGVSVPDLLPLPLTHEALSCVSRNVMQVQEALQRSIAVENISAYLDYQFGDWSEVDFLGELAQRAGCTLLVDINNIHVNQLNHGSSAEDFLKGLNPSHVSQWHLGGPTEVAGAWIDTHASTVPEAVWRLLDIAIRRIGPRPTVVEWDQDLPPLTELLNLVNRARSAIESREAAGCVP